MSHQNSFNMFTGIKIYCPSDLTKRAYVHTHIMGKRFKFYNGKPLGILCFPNKCKNLTDRKREIQRLAGEAYKKLVAGWNPEVSTRKEKSNIVYVLQFIQSTIAKNSYSPTYIRDLNDTTGQFIQYLQKNKFSDLAIDEILPAHIESFLERFSKSGTYYMNKRRFLSVTFSKCIQLGYLNINPVKKTSKRKVKIRLNESFKGGQLIEVLNYLKENNTNLYLCALLMYGTLLRPHREIRLLTKKNFADDLSYIILDGHRNKSGNIRKTTTPEYVRTAIRELNIDQLKDDDNIFTRTRDPLNIYYFNLVWGRLKKRMVSLGLINKNQTLYSFRHTAAVNVFTKHQNLHLIQKLFAHSNLAVSLNYLRSLGSAEITDERLLPGLE